MKILTRRLLILFSVALNIGFILFALNNMFNQGSHKHKYNMNKLIGMVESLDLSEDKEKEAISCITRFDEKISSFSRDFSRDREAIMLYLSQPGELDQEHLDRLIRTIDRKERIKRDLFMAHVMELRTILGDKKGPLFFSRMVAQHKDNHSDEMPNQ